MGGDAPLDTSVGQVRVVDLPGPELFFDMFHGYEEGGKCVRWEFFSCSSVRSQIIIILTRRRD